MKSKPFQERFLTSKHECKNLFIFSPRLIHKGKKKSIRLTVDYNSIYIGGLPLSLLLVSYISDW